MTAHDEASDPQNTRNGATARGETARGETARGETARGETARGETARGETARGGETARSDETARNGENTRSAEKARSIGKARDSGTTQSEADTRSVEYDGPEYDGPAYDGMDALMAALLDEPLPAPARQDAAFMAARSDAVADLAVLREQLALIGDALAAPDGTEDAVPTGRHEAAHPGRRPEPDDGPGQDASARPSAGTVPGTETGPPSAPRAPLRSLPSRSGKRPAPGDGPEPPVGPESPADSEPPVGPESPVGPEWPVGPESPAGQGSGVGPGPGDDTRNRAAGHPQARHPGTGRPGTAGGSRGPRRPRRRPLKVALGALAAVAAATVVVGMGWLVTHPGGAADASADKGVAADSREADSQAGGGVAFGSPRYLACARLVAEGTVLALDPVPGAAGTERVTLQASRVYKGDGANEGGSASDGDSEAEITFLRDTAGDRPLHPGDLVMIGLPLQGAHPDMVLVGETDIAPERARITASLPESRTLTCG
ncbi:hypothetical protein AB0D65_33750 [Streptomyces griseoloalbus]|uniref:Uncharacterized protein n=1 Tax=Streptomyces griseoloalbus TaxID=67303 RepID=A0ABV3EF96_9ACTN